MKPRFSNFLHGLPWWVVFASGLAVTIALAIFVTPFHTLKLEKSGSTAAENRAIKREIDVAFSEGAIEIAQGIVSEMREHAKDPARREELDRALEEIERARSTLREAGAEALLAKRQAADEVSQAVKEAHDALVQAQKEAAGAVKDSGPEGERLRQSLEDSLKAAQAAQEQARRIGEEPKTGKDGGPVVILPHGRSRLLQVDPAPPGSVPAPPLPPEVRAQIRRKLSTDLWRIGIGSGLLLIFLPLFILTVVAKFFIDRSRAAQRMAEAKKREAEYHSMRRQVTEAKLSALQAQVEPHFLYNTLASVQALTEVDPQRASEMTGHLIHYLRNALPKMREAVSTVGQEVELVRAYLNILQMRMGKRLAFEIDVPPELLGAPFPPLMLPSLVENAIKHGLEPLREGGMVRITAEALDHRLRLRVADTGRGFSDAPGTGVGLANIRERLAALYGDAAHFTLEANAPQGVVATIDIPRAPPAAEAVAAASAPGASTRSAPDFQDEATLAAAATPNPSGAAPQPPAAPTRTARFVAGVAVAERAWRKGLTYVFMVLAAVAAILAALAAVGVVTGVLPVHFGTQIMGGAAGAFLGTAGVAIGFIVVVLALAIVLALVYGLGFLLAGIFIVVAAVVAIALFPVLAPFILLGLGIAWLVRRLQRTNATAATLESAHADRNPG
ncbi:MAG TPA: histidine kinase [Usitatibacter sp.]|jgi:hypothetical protein|nr:histidine kinase [Usitatibacter sp.]